MLKYEQYTRRPGYAGGRAVETWEAHLYRRSTNKHYIDMEANVALRPYYSGVYEGSPAEREARS